MSSKSKSMRRRKEHLFRVAELWLERADRANVNQDEDKTSIAIGKAREALGLLKNTAWIEADAGKEK